MYIAPNVIASVIGIASAISSADRHSQKPIHATRTTSTIASYSAFHEQVEVLTYLTRLIGGSGDNQVFGEPVSQSVERLIDGLAERADLFTRAHKNRQRDCTVAIPSPVRGARGIKVEQLWWVLIAPQDFGQIA